MAIISPQLPTLGQPNATEDADVLNALQDLVDEVNGALDDANMATGNKASELLASWRTVRRAACPVGPGAGTFVIGEGDSTSVALTASTRAWGVFYFNPTDVAVTGRTTNLRLRSTLLNNGTALTGLTVALAPITAASGGTGVVGLTVGSGVTGSSHTVDGTINGAAIATSSTFAAPTANPYALVLVATGAAAAAFGSLHVELQVQNV